LKNPLNLGSELQWKTSAKVAMSSPSTVASLVMSAFMDRKLMNSG
jgi:hypothetical protein